MLDLCFGVGNNNFATGREWRTADLVAALEREGLAVLVAYGATGNVAGIRERVFGDVD
jgi:hypothetical protein